LRRSVWTLVLVGAMVLGAGNASAKTPDKQTPSQETICDSLSGAEYGLCTAYCEAMDCDDPNKSASDQACEAVRRNFENKAGVPPPCLTATCPCGTALTLFQDITSGAVQVQSCVADETIIFVTTTTGATAVIDSTALNCSVNAGPPLVPLTPNEAMACRITLRKAVEAQGRQCFFPEFHASPNE